MTAAERPDWLPTEAELAEDARRRAARATNATVNVHMYDTPITVDHYPDAGHGLWSGIGVGGGVCLHMRTAAQCDALIAAAVAARAHVTGETEGGGHG